MLFLILTIYFLHSPRISAIYEDLEQKINSANDKNDLQWWSDNHGVDMPMYWPTFEVINCLFYLTWTIYINYSQPYLHRQLSRSCTFVNALVYSLQEYSPDMHSISRKKGNGSGMNSDGITLTSLKKDNSHTVARESSVQSKSSTQYPGYNSQDSQAARYVYI